MLHELPQKKKKKRKKSLSRRPAVNPARSQPLVEHRCSQRLIPCTRAQAPPGPGNVPTDDEPVVRGKIKAELHQHQLADVGPCPEHPPREVGAPDPRRSHHRVFRHLRSNTTWVGMKGSGRCVSAEKPRRRLTPGLGSSRVPLSCCCFGRRVPVEFAGGCLPGSAERHPSPAPVSSPLSPDGADTPNVYRAAPAPCQAVRSPDPGWSLNPANPSRRRSRRKEPEQLHARAGPRGMPSGSRSTSRHVLQECDAVERQRSAAQRSTCHARPMVRRHKRGGSPDRSGSGNLVPRRGIPELSSLCGGGEFAPASRRKPTPTRPLIPQVRVTGTGRSRTPHPSVARTRASSQVPRRSRGVTAPLADC